MSMKYKIILGFFFMVALLVGLAALGRQTFNTALSGFDGYTSGAETAISAYAADGQVRDIKAQIDHFLLTLNPASMQAAVRNLDSSVGYVEQAATVERDATKRDQLTAQITALRAMRQDMDVLGSRLIAAHEVVTATMLPAFAAFNTAIGELARAALAAGNQPLFDQCTALYALAAECGMSARVYEANYESVDMTNALRLMQAMDDWRVQARALISRAPASVPDGGVAAALAELEQRMAAFGESVRNMVQIIHTGIAARSRLFASSDAMQVFFDTYTQNARNTANQYGTALRTANARGQQMLFWLSAAGLLVGLAIAGWIVVSISRLLKRISHFAGEIAHGRFDARLDIHEKGEIGSMVASLQTIPVTLEGMVTEYSRLEQAIENGYLDVQLDTGRFAGGFGSIIRVTNLILKRFGFIFNNLPSPIVVLDRHLKATYLNTVAQQLAGSNYASKTCKELFAREDYGTATCGLTNAVRDHKPHGSDTVAHPLGTRLDIHYTAIPMLTEQGEMTSVLQLILDLTATKDTERKIVEIANQALANVADVASAASLLAEQVSQVSRGADIQRTRVEATAGAMTEMNATVLEVARNAAYASDQSNQTRENAESGAAIMSKMVAAITNVNTVALALQNNMQELGQQAKNIGSVINVINDIADQTNLLALNAAIEAARAGDAGRGFAVVADEVRKLAEKTMSATTEVSNSIQAIQRSAQGNVSDVNSAVGHISETNELAQRSGEALHEIVTLAASSSSVVSSIATAAEEQSAASEEINKSLDEVSLIVGETTNGMAQAAIAVRSLSQTAQHLKTIMERLRS